jgi:hypothetical protein
MGKKLAAIRGKVAAVAVGAALLATGVGFGAHAALSSPGTRTTSDTTAVTSPAATTSATSDAATSSDPAPTPSGTSSGADTGAATVAAVTTPDPQPTQADSPVPTPDPGADQTPVAERTLGGELPTPASMPPLPGEPGYTPPAG